MVFLFYSDLKQIRNFVAKRREMSKIRAFLVSFLTQQMRFDSDFTQTSGHKNADWSLCSGPKTAYKIKLS